MARPVVNRNDRIKLVRTSDPYTELRPGDEGTVLFVRHVEGFGWNVDVSWDSGSSLSLLPDVGDEFEVVVRSETP